MQIHETFVDIMLTNRQFTVTRLRPLGRSAHSLRLHFWLLANAAEMGSYDGVALGLHRRQM
jgi:hypothetical protein